MIGALLISSVDTIHYLKPLMSKPKTACGRRILSIYRAKRKALTLNQLEIRYTAKPAEATCPGCREAIHRESTHKE